MANRLLKCLLSSDDRRTCIVRVWLPGLQMGVDTCILTEVDISTVHCFQQSELTDNIHTVLALNDSGIDTGCPDHRYNMYSRAHWICLLCQADGDYHLE